VGDNSCVCQMVFLRYVQSPFQMKIFFDGIDRFLLGGQRFLRAPFILAA